MKTVTVQAAKTHLSRLIEEAVAGEEIVIARGRTPIARLVAISVPKSARRFGAMRGRARVTRAFFESLPAVELEVWE